MRVDSNISLGFVLFVVGAAKGAGCCFQRLLYVMFCWWVSSAGGGGFDQNTEGPRNEPGPFAKLGIRS